MSLDIPAFDGVYVISDLHLGGLPGRQIFGLADRLSAMIHRLAEQGEGRRALVINGDFVDFLAEEPAEYFDGARAVKKLERIVADPELGKVFQALREFIGFAQRELVIVLGNHDVELSLPHVQHWLGSWLSQDDASKRGRLSFATDGAGFACDVGGKRVLCIHGNEFDDWNVIDHRALLQYVRAWNRGQQLPAWTPNGGTRLVIDVMNEAKRAHAMVDLLKPETKAAVPMLLAFSPELLGRAGAALRAVSVRTYDGLRMATGFLGAENVRAEQRPSESEALADALSGLAATSPGGSSKGALDEVREAQLRIERHEPLPRYGDANAQMGTLGLREWWDKQSQPTLRKALQKWLANDKTFDIAEKDSTFLAVDEAIGSGVHYVLAGHTHLRRALPRRWQGCYYFNTGTWIRLIEIPPQLLESEASFEPVVLALKNRNLEQLDKTSLGTPPAKLIKHVPTVGSVELLDGKVVGRLNDVIESGQLKPVNGAQFP